MLHMSLLTGLHRKSFIYRSHTWTWRRTPSFYPIYMKVCVSIHYLYLIFPDLAHGGHVACAVRARCCRNYGKCGYQAAFRQINFAQLTSVIQGKLQMWTMFGPNFLCLFCDRNPWQLHEWRDWLSFSLYVQESICIFLNLMSFKVISAQVRLETVTPLSLRMKRMSFNHKWNIFFWVTCF